MDKLDDIFGKMPEVIRVKDGDVITDCCLTFSYYSKKHKWTAAYYSSEFDYYLSCGYGDTLVDALKHLRRTIKDIKVRTDSDYDYEL